MKHFKILNLNRQHVGPFTATEQWMKEAQKQKGFEKEFKNMGECDANGHLLSEISKDNFSSEKTEIPPIFTEKTKENGKRETNTGEQAGKVSAKKAGNTSGGTKKSSEPAV